MSEIKDEAQMNMNFMPGHPMVSEMTRLISMKGDPHFPLDKRTQISEEMEKIIYKLITHLKENY
jgi:hypothetical protein